MTPYWQSILTQLIFLSGILALTFAALEDSSAEVSFRPTKYVAFEQVREDIARP